MYLSSVEIKNFRCFKHLHIEFLPGLNVLIGRNNTGKTNLLYAIRHAVGPAASHGDTLWLDRDDFYRDSATDVIDRTISVTLTFSGLSEVHRAHFYEIVNFDLANIDNSKAIVRFEAFWPKIKRRPTIKRTGGTPSNEASEVPTPLLESLPITFLPALRDAEIALAPGYRSRLALLLREMASRINQDIESEIVDIFSDANKNLEAHKLISKTTKSLQETTKMIAGTDHAPSAIHAADAEFDKILRTLQVQMKSAPIGSLSANGLGFNNLLYMAVVLEHLKSPVADECPIFLVEEPEAHLHPQLTMLLAEYLANTTPGTKTPQTLVTTHSPTLAASVPPSRIHILSSNQAENMLFCNSVAKARMTPQEEGQLQRMMDVTRATLYFAKGIILVEGISEALLIPVLAKRIGYDLSKQHISVIPISGVAFETFKKLLDPAVFGIPVAIVTDADPIVTRGPSWDTDLPETEGQAFKLCDRTQKLLGLFVSHPTVKVFHSKLTLEYDLADAGDDNALIMGQVWESCFVGTPRTFNNSIVANAETDRSQKALVAWRGICRAEHSGSKADFAHHLSAKLAERGEDGQPKSTFDVPQYVKDAVEYVANATHPPAPTKNA